MNSLTESNDVKNVISETDSSVVTEVLAAKKPFSKKQRILISISVVFVIALILFSVLFLPNLLHSIKANSALKRNDYNTAITEFQQMNGAWGSSEKIKETYYAQAVSFFAEKKYREAAEIFQKVKGYADADAKIEECASLSMKSGEYDIAAGIFKDLSGVDMKQKYNYCLGMSAYAEKKYEEALEHFKEAGELFDSGNKKNECNYLLGKQLIKSNYAKAKNYFQQAGTYSDAKKMITACDFLAAEELFDAGCLNEAKKAYNKISADFSYDGKTVKQRLDTLDKCSSIVNACGKWKASYNYIESRNVWKYNGSWDNWYLDQVEKAQTITIHCKANANNTFTVEGTVSFYRFTNFSSLSAYCNATMKTVNFKIPNVTVIPDKYVIADNTTLKYTNGVFSLSYSVRDDYSSNFYNLYRSDVTYGTVVEKY